MDKGDNLLENPVDQKSASDIPEGSTTDPSQNDTGPTGNENSSAETDTAQTAEDESVCRNCGRNPVVEGYTIPLCSKCRHHYINYPIPRWIKVFSIVVLSLIIYSLISFTKVLEGGNARERGNRAESQHMYVSAAGQYEKVVSIFPKAQEAFSVIEGKKSSNDGEYRIVDEENTAIDTTSLYNNNGQTGNFDEALAECKSVLADIANKTAITSNHHFVDTDARDAYFTDHPTELEADIFISLGAGFQQYIDGEWKDKTAVINNMTAEQTPFPTFEFTPVTGIDRLMCVVSSTGVIFCRSGTKILRSADGGATKPEVLDMGVGVTPFSMLVNDAGYGIAFGQKTNGDGVMYSTADAGATWTHVDTSATGANIDPFAPPYYTGIANITTNWAFFEYRGGTYVGNYRIFTCHSNNFNAIYIRKTLASTAVRHGHDIEAINDTFLATTGDLNAELKWIVSAVSNGTGAWNEVTIPASQKMRTTKIIPTSDGKVMWVADGVEFGVGGVYQTTFNPLIPTKILDANIEHLLYFPQPGLSIVRSGKLILASESHEHSKLGDWAGYIYASIDEGQSWRVIRREPKTQVTYVLGSFEQILGPDRDGNFYVNCLDSAAGVKTYKLIVTW